MPLANWESLYYALIAEVRHLYNELKQTYGGDFGRGTAILHPFGENATSSGSEPFSALRFAAELESFWKELMDNRLVAALDIAVREKQIEEQISSGMQTMNSSQRAAAVDNADGLMDVNGMTYDEIMDILWTKHAPEIERKATENVNSRTLLAACRAEVREAGSNRSSAESTCSRNIHCKCGETCDCRMECNFQTNECSCAHVRRQVQDLVDDNLKVAKGVRQGLGPSVAFPQHLFGAMCNDISQMYVAAQAAPDPYLVQAANSANEDAAIRDAQLLEFHRQRAKAKDTAVVATLQPRTPTYDAKEKYPLGFYGDISDHRYPPMRREAHVGPPPVFAASAFVNEVPSRKPVPPPTSSLPAPPSRPSLPPFAFPSSRTRPGEQVPTPSSSPLDAQSFAQAGQVYNMPVEQSHAQGTHSSPAPTVGYRRPTNIDRTVSAATYVDLAQEAHAAVSPYAEDTDPPSSPLPLQPRRQQKLLSSSPPEAAGSNKSRRDRDASEEADEALPLPDFISPRPAVRQRYVSAGGYAKLEDRPEIPGPALVQTSTGASINKEELFAKLDDPEFIRQNFGEDAVKLAMQRNSKDSAAASNRVSERSSALRESSEANFDQGEKRGRTESGASTGSVGRFSKLKRVFSRKSSEGENE